MNTATAFHTPEALAAKGSRLAWVEADQRMSYSDLAEQIAKLTKAWRPLPNSRILLNGDSQGAQLCGLLAIAPTTHVAIPAAPFSSASDLKQAARQAYATHLWCSSRLPSLSTTLTVSSDTPESPHPLFAKLTLCQRAGLVLFTSGTTGRSKTILHDLPKLLYSQQPVKQGRARRILLLMHLDHIGGLDIAVKALANCSTIYVPPSRNPETVGRWISEHAIEVLPATPTFLRLALLNGMFSRFDCHSLRIITYGAEKMPPQLLSALKRELPTVQLRATFGTTETGTVRLHSNDNDNGRLYAEQDNQGLRVIDGELWIKTPATLVGYLDEHQPRIDAEGWLATGDRAEVAEDGGIHITGRNTKLVSIGGEKVDLLEVENALLEVEGVFAAWVTADEHPLTGHTLNARIAVAPDADNLSLQEWKQRMRRTLMAKLPRWKIPTKLTIESQGKADSGPRLKGEYKR